MNDENSKQHSKSSFYFACPSCGNVISDPEWHLADINVPAPCCGATGKLRGPWPDSPIRRLIEISSSQDLDTIEGKRTAIIFMYSGVQLLFEKILWKLISCGSERKKTSSETFPQCICIENIIASYNQLSDYPLEKLLESWGEEKFFKALIYLSNARNKILQDTYSSLSARNDGNDETDIIDRVKADVLEIFSVIQNDINRQIIENLKDSKGKTPSVLVVDDEDEVRRNLGRFLVKKGLKVYSSESGRSAVETYEKYKVDFVLLDVMLPDIDGLDVLKIIKEKDPQAKVFFLTGVDGRSFKTEAQKLGAAGHFVKPMSLDEIWEAVKKI